MSLFDRFVSRRTTGETGGQEKKPVFPTHYMTAFSDLDISANEAKELYPDDTKTVDDFLWALKESARARYQKALDDPDPLKAEAQFFLSRDRMCVYACLFPPENDGDEITLEEFLEDIHYEGISYGILNEQIPQEFALGYLHMFPVARGKPPCAGKDGEVVELFQRRKNMRLEVQNGSEVDFSEDIPLQPIRKGSIICLIQPPKAGTNGIDVTGQELPCPKAVSATVPQGENTMINEGGLTLSASVDGILYIENNLFCIHEQRIIDNSLDKFQGEIQIPGNVYINGDVDGGVTLETTGDIVVNGKIRQARIVSLEGTIRIQQGVYGTEGKTQLIAACQVQTPVVECASIEAGTSVIAETILNSSIRCSGTVYVMSGRGMIVDSQIQTEDSILCQRIGNLAGGRCQFSVGYPPDILDSWKHANKELTEIQPTIDKLWAAITELRRKSTRITPQERALLNVLIEQRDLYTEKREALTAELKTANTALNKKSKGRVRCEKLYPSLEIQIGRFSEEITTIEEKCNIHVDGDKIILQ